MPLRPVSSSTLDVGRGRTERRTSNVERRARIAYAELHCHSNFSFLDGTSDPEELVERAAELGLSALALTDTNGLYGIVRFAAALKACAERAGKAPWAIVGAEL